MDRIHCCHVDRQGATEILEELLQRAEQRGDEREEVTTNNRADRCFLGNFLRRVESIFVNNEAKTNCVNL